MKIYLDISLPDSVYFRRTLELFGPIVPEESNYKIMGTKVSVSCLINACLPTSRKVELNLKKKDNRSWNLLEKTDHPLGGYNIIFGVGGKTGTTGSRESPVLAEYNKIKE